MTVAIYTVRISLQAAPARMADVLLSKRHSCAAVADRSFGGHLAANSEVQLICTGTLSATPISQSA